MLCSKAALHVSKQQLNHFVDMFASALHSVCEPPPEALSRISILLHWFQDSVATPDLPGCSQGRVNWVLSHLHPVSLTSLPPSFPLSPSPFLKLPHPLPPYLRWVPSIL